MRKGKWFILIALILSISLGLFYIYKINIFNADTLKSIDISTITEDTVAEGTPQEYTLSTTETKRLFSGLSSVVEEDLILDDSISFEMTLMNKWNVSRNYLVSFSSDHNIYLKASDENQTFLVQNPSFFNSFLGFDSLYKDASFPEIQIELNNKAYGYQLSNINWHFKRLDNIWAKSDVAPSTVDNDSFKITAQEENIVLNISKRPTSVNLKIIDEATKGVVFEGPSTDTSLQIPGYDGSFIYEIGLEWQDDNYIGSAHVTMPVVVDLPEKIVLSKSMLKQGDLLNISIYYAANPSIIELVQDLYPDFKWYDENGVIQGYIPTNYSTTPGVYSLKFTNTETGSTSTHDIEVVSRDFRVQNLTVDTSVESSTRTDEGYAEYRKYFNPSREISSPVKYYTEPFILPTPGKLTTEFGESRVVNGSLTTYRHAGIDIAAPRNAEVLATNTGKVMLAMPLILTGNSIVIDHGEGLFSVYFHLDKLFVNEGDFVERGQLIGAVGTTGFSTGPHLHFTMSYYRFDIEPGYILYGETITKENYVELMK